MRNIFFRSQSQRHASLVFCRSIPLISHQLPSRLMKGAVQGGLVVDPAQYREVKRDTHVVDNHFGVLIPDPYRWLEDANSEATQKFVEEQNQLTRWVLDQCPDRERFKALLTSLYNYPRYGCPFRSGSRYYYFHNTGLQAQSVLYTQTDLDEPAHVFLDPNTFSEDGTVSLANYEFSEDNSLLAYSINSGGSDWQTILVGRVTHEGKLEMLEDKLEFVKFSNIAWTHDHKGFFYSRYPPPEDAGDLGTETHTNRHQSLWYHRIGQAQAQDTLIVDCPADEPEWLFSGDITQDGRYLLITVSCGCLPVNQLWYLDLQQLEGGGDEGLSWGPHLPIVKLVDNFDAKYWLVVNEGPVWTVKTNLNAPRNRLVRVDIGNAGPPSEWVDVIGQHERDLLLWAAAPKGDTLVVCWLRDAASYLELRSLSSGALVRLLPLPGLGSVGSFSSRRQDSEFFFSFSSFTEPGAIFRCDVAAADPAPRLFKRNQLAVAFHPDSWETKQVFVDSKDGTRVPMFIVHKKGLVLDGANPTLLYGYGGFNICITPFFSVAHLCFMLAYGGVYAVANVRGGGEYGVEWRNGGSRLNKHNSFDDFIAAAEYLCQQRYCSPAKLTIEGRSNGGMLVAACANQRPDLFACVLAGVGVMDMTRFHKFTIGHAWTTDFGDPDNEEDLRYLLTYSPLHNVRQLPGGSQQSPAVLLFTGDHDDRVPPLHSHKLIATLQHELVKAPEQPQQRNPLLIRVEVRAGHGAGKPTAKVIEELSDLYSFAAAVMGATWQA